MKLAQYKTLVGGFPDWEETAMLLEVAHTEGDMAALVELKQKLDQAIASPLLRHRLKASMQASSPSERPIPPTQDALAAYHALYVKGGQKDFDASFRLAQASNPSSVADYFSAALARSELGGPEIRQLAYEGALNRGFASFGLEPTPYLMSCRISVGLRCHRPARIDSRLAMVQTRCSSMQRSHRLRSVCQQEPH